MRFKYCVWTAWFCYDILIKTNKKAKIDNASEEIKYFYISITLWFMSSYVFPILQAYIERNYRQLSVLIIVLNVDQYIFDVMI